MKTNQQQKMMRNTVTVTKVAKANVKLIKEKS